jgi:hypothetical protein
MKDLGRETYMIGFVVKALFSSSPNIAHYFVLFCRVQEARIPSGFRQGRQNSIVTMVRLAWEQVVTDLTGLVVQEKRKALLDRFYNNFDLQVCLVLATWCDSCRL